MIRVATIRKAGQVLVVPDDTVEDYLKQGWSIPRDERTKTSRKKKAAKPKKES